MKFNIGDKLSIENNSYTIKDSIKREFSDFSEGENKVYYYTFDLESKDKNVTHAAFDYISDSEIIFHLTKKVKSKFEKPDVWIGDKKYLISKEKKEVYLDENGELAHAKCYEVVGCKTGIPPSELHVLPDNSEIFYLTLKLNKSDIILENVKD